MAFSKSVDDGQSALECPSDRLTALYNHPRLCDLTITFPGHQETLKAHRLILAISSPVFELMLYGSMAEGNELKLPMDPPEAFKLLLKYIYCGSLKLPCVAEAVDVYILANRYQMDKVFHQCSRFLQNNLDKDNLPMVYDTASLFEDKALQEKCSEIINATENSTMPRSNIEQLGRKSLRHFLEQDFSLLSEVYLFKGLISWAANHLGDQSSNSFTLNQRHQVEEFLPLIRFLTMTTDEFVENVLPTNVLTPKESNRILMNIKSVGNMQLPPVCSESKMKRTQGLNMCFSPKNLCLPDEKVTRAAPKPTIKRRTAIPYRRPTTVRAHERPSVYRCYRN